MPVSKQSWPSIAASVVETLILAYKENTGELESALREEGLSPEVLRPSYTAEELRYSRTIRCLLNHAGAWRRAAAGTGLTLIMEADFVPCEGFGRLPLPFDPSVHAGAAWAFLYAGGPRIFRVWPDGGLQGHAACPVAYVVSPRVAELLSRYTREELARHGDLSRYSLWDTQFQWHLMGWGAVCFMPFRQYGEHGGLSNPEHRQAGVGMASRARWLGWLGVGQNHHAEVLFGPLKFLPPYARGKRATFWRTRLEAKLIGWLKFFCGRVAIPPDAASFRERCRLRLACLRRLCSLY